MIYNPVENRFYKQVAIAAHDKEGNMLNVRENPKAILRNGITVILVPAGGCIGEWEEVVDLKSS